MTRIPLRNRAGETVAYALVDADLADDLNRWRWSLDPAGYARRNTTIRGRWVRIVMHRQILGLGHGDPRKSDHINRDRLDNRRSNLRVATHAQNCQNVAANRGGSSVHRGVSLHKQTGKWQSSVQVNGKLHYLGLYNDELEAARVAAAFRREHMPFSEMDRVAA